jgi:hypothetical protein
VLCAGRIPQQQVPSIGGDDFGDHEP